MSLLGVPCGVPGDSDDNSAGSRAAPAGTTAAPGRPMRYFLLLSLGACMAPIHIAGGPENATHDVPAAKLGEGLRPLVATEPAAVSELDAVSSRETTATWLIYGGIALLAPCIGLPAADKYQGGALTWAGIGACAGSIILDLAGIIVAPSQSSYGDVLRTYNDHHPEAPWVAPALDVTPASRGERR